MFSGLITSKTKIRILMRLFLNPDQEAHLRGLAEEFHISPSLVGEELKHLNKAGLLVCKKNGRQIDYRANQKHPLFPELQSMVKKALGMDRILESIIERLGDLKLAFLLGDYAQGRDSGIVDLVLVGNIDRQNLDDLVQKTERYIARKIRTLVLDEREYEDMKALFQKRSFLLLWERGTA